MKFEDMDTTHLKSISDRLNNQRLGKLEESQRRAYCNIVKNLPVGKDGYEALSVSVGDGVWDYLLFDNNRLIKKIVATDVVKCPVSTHDQKMFSRYGRWEFQKVDKSGLLPFDDERFDFIFHQDVIEHTATPYRFLKEQYRVLKKDGFILVGTPNLFRPANILKVIFGKLRFPHKISFNEEIGDYVHFQEFYEQQLLLLLEEVGFGKIDVFHCYWGLSFTNICFSMFPKSNIGKSLCHFLMFRGQK